MLKKSVGLGTFPFSNVFSTITKNEIERVIHRFIDLGGFYIESALIYDGVNEMLGEILSRIPRESYYLSTKCVTTVGKNGEKYRTGKYEAIIQQCEEQLKDLGIDYLDLLMMHYPPPDASYEESISALAELRKQGKIRDIGVSNVDISQLKEFNRTNEIQFVQNRFSLIHQTNTDEMNQYCKENNIKYIPYQVIERSQLTNKARVPSNMRDKDLRLNKPEFKESPLFVISKWSETHLIPLAKQFDTSVEALAIWWVLQQPQVQVCVVGATSVDQVASNLDAMIKILPREVLEQLDSAYKDLEQGIKLLFGNTVIEFRGLS